MAIQLKNLGTAPTGAGGDTNRSGAAKDNENFSNQQHAASRMVGTATGNVMEVGAFGLGGSKDTAIGPSGLMYGTNRFFSWHEDTGGQSNIGGSGWMYGLNCGWLDTSGFQVGRTVGVGYPIKWRSSEAKKWETFYTTQNTTRDSNGFLKAASPIIQLFCDHITTNDEAAEQNPILEKLGTGHYLIKGTEGFATQGWWIQVPTDTNGNKICAVEYKTLENGDLEINTFKKKLNDDGDIVANLDKPIDIPSNSNGEPRWIDIRLNELPKKPSAQRIPRTEKQPKMVKQLKYAPQLTYITKLEDLYDDEGKPVIVGGKNYQKPTTHIHTDVNGTPILTDQQVMNEKGEPVFELVQAVDSDGKPVFEDAPVLDEHGEQIYDEVTHDPVE